MLTIDFDRKGMSNRKFFNEESGEYESTYQIQKSGKEYVVINRKTGNIECAAKYRREVLHEMRMRESGKIDYHTEIDDGFAAGGGWRGGCCITGDGNGSAWHRDEAGNIVED